MQKKNPKFLKRFQMEVCDVLYKCFVVGHMTYIYIDEEVPAHFFQVYLTTMVSQEVLLDSLCLVMDVLIFGYHNLFFSYLLSFLLFLLIPQV